MSFAGIIVRGYGENQQIILQGYGEGHITIDFKRFRRKYKYVKEYSWRIKLPVFKENYKQITIYNPLKITKSKILSLYLGIFKLDKKQILIDCKINKSKLKLIPIYSEILKSEINKVQVYSNVFKSNEEEKVITAKINHKNLINLLNI